MTQVLLYAGSSLLILLGAFLLWRDQRKSARKPARRLSGEDHVAAVVEAIAARKQQVTRTGTAVATVTLQPPSQSSSRPPSLPAIVPTALLPVPVTRPPNDVEVLQATIARVSVEWDDEMRPEAVRNPHAERRWGQLAPVVARACSDMNDVLAPAAIAIGPPGEPGWSFKNRGYGQFRRVRIAGGSAAWLRFEVGIDGRFEVTLRSHDDVRSFLNERASMDSGQVTLASAADMVARVLLRIGEYGARNLPYNKAEAHVARKAWDEIAPTVAAALHAANQRLAPSRGRLEAASMPQWDGDLQRYRLAMQLMAGGVPFGQLTVACGGVDVELQIVPPRGAPRDLAARGTLPIDGIATEQLSGLVAELAQPVLAYALAEPAPAKPLAS